MQLMEQPCFAGCFEVFGSASSPYLVCEYLSLTLGHILGLPLLPTEVEVAAIAGQVRCGIVGLVALLACIVLLFGRMLQGERFDVLGKRMKS